MLANNRAQRCTCVAALGLAAILAGSMGCAPNAANTQMEFTMQDQRTEPMDMRAVKALPEAGAARVRAVLAVHDCDGAFSEQYKLSQYPLPSEDRKRWRDMGTDYFPRRLADYLRERRIVLDAIREHYEAADLHLHITLNAFRKDWSHEYAHKMETRIDSGKMAMSMIPVVGIFQRGNIVRMTTTEVDRWTLTSEVDADCVLTSASGAKLCEFKLQQRMDPQVQEKVHESDGTGPRALMRGMPDDVQGAFDDAVRELLVKVMGTVEARLVELRPQYGQLERPDLDQAQKLSDELLYGKPRSQWAVVIGISRYERGGTQFPDLQFADRDAREFCELLMSPAGGGFTKDHILLLINQEATYSAIRNGLFTFLKDAEEDDLIVVFFSGHGAPDPARPENLYLLPHDVDAGNIAATGFPMWDMEKVLWQIVKSQRVVVFADACHSAGVTAGLGVKGVNAEAAGENVYSRYFRRLAHTRPGRVVLSSSGGNEQSLEGSKWDRHGVFTWALLQGLKGAADGAVPGTQKDGIVTLQEIVAYVQQQVVQETQNRQRPFLAASPKYDGDLPLGIVSTSNSP